VTLVQVVVDGGDLEPAAEETRHYGRHFLVEQDKITHDHRLVAHLLERRVGPKGEPGPHWDTFDGDGEVSARHPDAQDVAGLHLTPLAERLLNRIPVRIGGGRQFRRTDDYYEAKKNDCALQHLGLHRGSLSLFTVQLR
jgi:hypothetical protein